MYGNYYSWTLTCRKAIQVTLPGGLPALAMKKKKGSQMQNN